MFCVKIVIKVQGEEVISDRSNMVCVKVVIKVQGKEVISDQSNMFRIIHVCNQHIHVVKPVLRGHLWDKDKWPYKTGDVSKEIQYI